MGFCYCHSNNARTGFCFTIDAETFIKSFYIINNVELVAVAKTMCVSAAATNWLVLEAVKGNKSSALTVSTLEEPGFRDGKAPLI